jgi:hypothetical protein
MRRILALLAGTALAGGVLAGTAAGDNKDAVPRGDSKTLRLLDVSDIFTYVDGGEPGEGPGDVLLFSNQLKHLGGAPAGRFVSTCTHVAGSTFKCAGTLQLANGTIELAATPDFAAEDSITAAVTGGTGSYRDVGGHATIVPTQTAGTSRLTVRLIELQD